MRNEFVFFSIVSILIVYVIHWFVWPLFIWIYVLLIPIILLGYYDMFQSRHAIMRNFPILGRGRYIFEELRPKIYQYFIESETNGKPIPRMYRSVVYQRAKKENETTPFGTQLEVYEEGYEWMNHSIGALDAHKMNSNPRVIIGGVDNPNAYAASIYNISAMSFGSLSRNAIEALNKGARIGQFAHNTGEGGISPYHLAGGGDLIYQIGTGYFGCRTLAGDFDPTMFKDKAELPTVRMIELKLSQGAKPGHGGILPAKKNTEEIARIRNVEAGTAVLSPPYHSAFNTPIGLLEFIQQLRILANGKPVGFKLCVGHPREFISICKAMLETEIYPDFISVDGGEGGTGAAPLEFSNSVGMPMTDGLVFVSDILRGFGLRDKIRLMASGKIITSFHMFKALALGADICYSARGMMLALGCIQALECNTNTCPTGVATQDEELVAGLKVEDKAERVANFHARSMQNFIELMAAAGKQHLTEIDRRDVFRRVSPYEVKTFEEIYPSIAHGAFAQGDIPAQWQGFYNEASAFRF